MMKKCSLFTFVCFLVLCTLSIGFTGCEILNSLTSASTDATLSLIVLKDSKGTNIRYSPNFSPDVTNYTASVSDTTKMVFVKAVSSSRTATIAGTGSLNITRDDQNIAITVTAQDMINTKTYFVALNRSGIGISSPLSNDSLSTQNFTVSGTWSGKITPDHISVIFAGQPPVSCTVNLDKTWSALVTAGAGLEQGTATDIIVTAFTSSNTVISSSFVKVTYDNPSAPQNSVGTLSSLSLKDNNGSPVILSPSFVTTTKDYTAIVGEAITSVNVEAIATSPKATVNVTTSVTLTSGENQIPITVTAQNGVTQTYTVKVTKKATQIDTKRNGTWSISTSEPDADDPSITHTSISRYIFNNGKYNKEDVYDGRILSSIGGTYTSDGTLLTFTPNDSSLRKEILYDLFIGNIFYPEAAFRTSSETAGLIGIWKSLASYDEDTKMLSYSIITVTSTELKITNYRSDNDEELNTNTIPITFDNSFIIYKIVIPADPANGIPEKTLFSKTRYILLDNGQYLSMGIAPPDGSEPLDDGGFIKE